MLANGDSQYYPSLEQLHHSNGTVEQKAQPIEYIASQYNVVTLFVSYYFNGWQAERGNAHVYSKRPCPVPFPPLAMQAYIIYEWSFQVCSMS